MTEKFSQIDAKDYFEKECKPLMKQLIGKCFLKGIPCFFTAAVRSNNDETEYVADGNMTGSGGFNLKEDRIKYHLMIQGGCVARPKRDVMEVSMDDFSSELEEDE